MNIQFNGVSPFGTNNTTGGVSANSANGADFQSELSAALTATLQKFGIDPNKISITIGQSGTNRTQFQNRPVTVASANIGSNAATTPFSAASGSSTTPTSGSTTPTNPTPAAGTTGPIGSGLTLSANDIQSYDDAYWSKQPAAVQKLRTMDDEDDRKQLAAQLAGQGFKIDVPIMIWGWDPAKVTNLRMAYGYSWVPSAGQQPIELAPGLAPFGSLLQYDPNSPPDGSILVKAS